jgi:putative drug exporter of the RND superfamily
MDEATVLELTQVSARRRDYELRRGEHVTGSLRFPSGRRSVALAEAEASGISYAVAGTTASTHDFSARMHSRAPVVFAFVLGLAFLLLLFTFRSIAVPLMSIALNLLSVGATYGLLTLIFQDGHLSGPLGFSPYGGIVTWMPLFLFVLLFGLSMDYHVFILSRIRELRLRGWTTTQAITGGIGGSAGVVTSAAVIMVAVFSIFATLSQIEFKMFGVAMAAAVLIDATVVRGVLMPAAMSLLGERSWYRPGWLSWLPGQQKAVPATSGGRKEMLGATTGR